jgi:hypothetical protein
MKFNFRVFFLFFFLFVSQILPAQNFNYTLTKYVVQHQVLAVTTTVAVPKDRTIKKFTLKLYYLSNIPAADVIYTSILSFKS